MSTEKATTHTKPNFQPDSPIHSGSLPVHIQKGPNKPYKHEI